MYLKNTPEFILLEKLHRAYRGQGKKDNSSLGIAKVKFGAPDAAIAQLKLDGYLTEIPRERWTALWITSSGITDFEAFKLTDLPPPPPPDLERDRALLLRGKLKLRTITAEEKAELSDIILKRSPL